jgi:hypothetical protein
MSRPVDVLWRDVNASYVRRKGFEKGADLMTACRRIWKKAKRHDIVSLWRWQSRGRQHTDISAP